MSKVKFVKEEEIPARKGHGARKYEDLYEALQKKPGAWAEITKAMKYTLAHRDAGEKTYPGVKTMKREDRFFASFQKEGPAKKTAKKVVKKSAKKGRRK